MSPASSVASLHLSVLLLNEENEPQKYQAPGSFVAEDKLQINGDSLLPAHPGMGCSLFYVAGLVHGLLFLLLSVRGLPLASIHVLPGYLVLAILQHCIKPWTLGFCPREICCIPGHSVIH